MYTLYKDSARDLYMTKIYTCRKSVSNLTQSSKLVMSLLGSETP